MTLPDDGPRPRPHKDGWAQSPGDTWQRSGRPGRARDRREPAAHERLRRAGADDVARPREPAVPTTWTPHEEWLPDPRPAPDRAWSPDAEWDRFATGLTVDRPARARAPRWLGVVAALLAATAAAATLLLG